MSEFETLSKAELLQLIEQNQQELASNQQELASHQQEQHKLATQLAQRDDVIKQLEARLSQAQKEYLELWKERFEARSERYIADPGQLLLDFGDSDEAADATEGLREAVEEADLIPEHKRRKPRKPRDESLPAHLPRKEVTLDVDEADKHCETHGEKTLLPESMWDTTEKLVYEPATLYVEVRKFPKYACANEPECGIASAERPTGIVEGDKYDTSVAAEILVNKFAYHLPIYRQQDMFAGTGWTPSRSTLLNILSNCFFVIQPLLAYFKQVALSDSIVGCDDTGVKLLYPKVPPDFDLSDPKQKRIAEVFAAARAENKSSINAKMWAYRSQSIKLNVFDFTVSRHRDGPDSFFEGYAGTILGDCWHGFGAIAARSEGSIVRAACNAHARRKFEAITAYPADRRKWLTWFQALYDIEDRGKELSEKARLELRKLESQVIWDAMQAELGTINDRTEHVVLPSSDLRKALNYLENHWSELTRYLDDPQLPMDNNECEQLMKQVALGRKNWLFCGSVAAGERNAGFMTLVSSAHRNDLYVWAYVNDVLRRLLAGETNYEPMLPWHWAASHPNPHLSPGRAQGSSRPPPNGSSPTSGSQKTAGAQEEKVSDSRSVPKNTHGAAGRLQQKGESLDYRP